MNAPLKALTIYEVATVEAAFAAQIQEQQPLKLNLGELQELDSAGVQWLLSLQARKARQGSDLYLSKISGLALETLKQLGLGETFSIETQGEDYAGF